MFSIAKVATLRQLKPEESNLTEAGNDSTSTSPPPIISITPFISPAPYCCVYPLPLPVPSGRRMPPKPTTALLTALRALMVKEPIHAYIVPSVDAHCSEYLAECDKRRAFISGFTGSAGTAIVTMKEACMWTDGRYFLQAQEEMDENWTLMKDGLPTTPTQSGWLSKILPTNSRIGVDPQMYPCNLWTPMATQLESAGHQLVPIATNLIDLVWGANKPAIPNNPVVPLALKYTGRSIREKLEVVRSRMVEKHCSILVLTALDEIAWMLNMRGSDIEYNPVFFSFVIIDANGLGVYIDKKKDTETVRKHLNEEVGEGYYTIADYSKTYEDLKANASKISDHVWMSNEASYAIASLVPPKHLLNEVTPPCLLKAVKNPTEIEGMKNAHIKDGIALCEYFSWLEKNVSSGNITEISGAKRLEEFRKKQADFVGPSFDTISSVGPHGAIIHYKPSPATDVPITMSAIYLCDSGGQYLDGTTDVTRTWHFGQPEDYERECFTRVLKGQIKLGTAIFPSKIKGNYLDSFAREFLWDVGLDYAHGTGHGIGSYLNVHEGPMGISWRLMPDDPGFEPGMFVSNEPGYYEDGRFGVRIEDIIQVVTAPTKHNFNNRGFLTFETITLCPIQAKLIAVDMLTPKEIEHINSYHKKCRDILGPLMDKQNLSEAKQWLWKETEPIKA